MSQKQKDKHGVWARPSQIFRNPTLIQHFTFESITQTLVADCSFVSSLAVCAAWERRFGRTLISRNIYPQQDGVPVMSPSGKYIVKMYLNGSVRKITIDDYLPVMQVGAPRGVPCPHPPGCRAPCPRSRQAGPGRRAGRTGADGGRGLVQESPSTLLCSFSSKGDELWVSLFEKAYIKLHAGYDFPGSTSSVDLHALCGWIPETLHLDPSSATPVDPAEAWTRLEQGHNKGTALFTIGTRALSDEEEDRTGLAGQHAYAVLEVVEACGRKLVKVKNPWCHMRWKGDFSPSDETNWTPELKAAVRYDQHAAQEVDNGIFWISWEAVLNFYNSIHCSWSPARFGVRRNVHAHWTKTHEDRHHLDDNPQYILRVNASRDTMVWLLLDRHYIETQDEPHIALHVYEGSRKIYYPSGALIHSVYRNSPHFLVRLPVPKGEQAFALVISIYDDTGVLPFTLSSYSAEPAALYAAFDCPAVEAKPGAFEKVGLFFSLVLGLFCCRTGSLLLLYRVSFAIPDDLGRERCLACEQSFRYKWTEDTAGGSMNEDSFDRNPMFKLSSSRAQRIFVKVRAAEAAAVKSDAKGPYVGVHLFQSGARVRRPYPQEVQVRAYKERVAVLKAECVLLL